MSKKLLKILKLKKTDLVIAAVFIAAAAAIFGIRGLTSSSGNYAEIYVKGKYYASLPLDKNTVYVPKDVPTVKIEVRDGKVAFTESDCPDKVCIHSGWLGKSGQTAVCLPNAISVTVKSQSSKDDDIDAVT